MRWRLPAVVSIAVAAGALGPPFGANADPTIDEAEALLRSGRFSEAQQAAERILRHDPRNLPAQLVAAGACADQLEVGCTKRHVDAIRELAPDSPAYKVLLGRLSLLKAANARREEDWEGERQYAAAAAASFADALATVPGQPETLGLRAKALREAGRYAEASQVCKAWLDAAPRDPEPYAEAAAAFTQAGAPGEIGALVDRIPRDDPERARALRFSVLRGATTNATRGALNALVDRIAAADTDPTTKLGLDAYRAVLDGDDPPTLLKVLDYLDADPEDHLGVGSLVARGVPGGGKPTAESQRIVLPVLLRDVQPRYPEVARGKREEGRVVILAKILKTGDVASAHVIFSIDRIFDQAAVGAVLGRKYEPATQDGVPIDFPYTIRVDFRVR